MCDGRHQTLIANDICTCKRHRTGTLLYFVYLFGSAGNGWLHERNLRPALLRLRLGEGQRVVVDMVEGGKGPEALNIRLI
jgi:hypothetical protein